LRSKSTKDVYLSGLKDFAKAVLGEGELDQILDGYLAEVKEGHDVFGDLLTYASVLAEKPPKTANSYMAGVKSFLDYAINFDLTKKQIKKLRSRMPKGKRARTIEDDLTRDRLRKILTHCDTKGKTLFLLLASSGIRVGEALQLELDDIHLKSEPVKINVRGEYTKTGDPYYSFISKEAKESLVEWLKIRGQYLLTSAKRGRGLAKSGHGRGVKSTEDKRIFPFSFHVANAMWNNALQKAGLENHDKGTNRRTLHIHMLRKYFNSQLKLVVPKEIVDALMGHEEGLSEAYRRYTYEEIKEWYQKGEPYLYIFVPQEIAQIRTRFEAEVEDLKNKVTDLLYQNQKLLFQRDELRSRVEALEKRVRQFDDFQKKYSWFFERLDEELRIMKENPPSKPVTEKEFRRKNPWLFRNVE